jgi:hypothetical protein
MAMPKPGGSKMTNDEMKMKLAKAINYLNLAQFALIEGESKDDVDPEWAAESVDAAYEAIDPVFTALGGTKGDLEKAHLEHLRRVEARDNAELLELKRRESRR